MRFDYVYVLCCHSHGEQYWKRGNRQTKTLETPYPINNPFTLVNTATMLIERAYCVRYHRAGGAIVAVVCLLSQPYSTRIAYPPSVLKDFHATSSPLIRKLVRKFHQSHL